jgi:hypothetical protein
MKRRPVNTRGLLAIRDGSNHRVRIERRIIAQMLSQVWMIPDEFRMVN